MSDLSSDVLGISAALDASYPAGLDWEARLWRRCSKMTEENGEVTEAILGMLGENPRKGTTHSVDDVAAEVLDVALAALAAYSHLHDNDCDPLAALGDHAARVHDRLRAALPAPVQAAEEVSGDEVPDLMEALKRSIDERKASRRSTTTDEEVGGRG